MTKTKNRSIRRVITLGLAILTLIALVFTLSSCSGSDDKLPPRTAAETADSDFIARVIAASGDSYRLRFVAASRGYDLTAEDFTDSDIDLGPNTAYGAKVLDDILNAVKFDNDTDRATFENYKNALTADTMKNVINSQSFKTEYELENEAGFPSILLVWIGKALGLLTRLVGNYYVVAIVIFAIIIEILMLPVSIKQQKNSIGMAKLRPQIAKIEKKYAGRTDQVTMRKKQEEIMELQQKSGYSPYSGCMPMLIQLIIVGFILYPIIQNPLRYVLDESTGFSSALLAYATSPKAAGGLGFTLSSEGNVMELLGILNKENIVGIADFALFKNGAEILAEYNTLNIPNFSALGVDLGPTPSFASILILVPILNVIGQWASMFLTRRWTNTGYNAMGAADGQDKFSMKIMDFVPLLMTVFILFQVPAMIGVYWLFRSLISLGKQFIMKKAMPVPKYTEEELREIEKAEKERQKAQKAALKQQPKYRSLHYIDEDDYEELPEVKHQNNTKKLNPGDAPEIKD